MRKSEFNAKSCFLMIGICVFNLNSSSCIIKTNAEHCSKKLFSFCYLGVGVIKKPLHLGNRKNMLFLSFLLVCLCEEVQMLNLTTTEVSATEFASIAPKNMETNVSTSSDYLTGKSETTFSANPETWGKNVTEISIASVAYLNQSSMVTSTLAVGTTNRSSGNNVNVTTSSFPTVKGDEAQDIETFFTVILASTLSDVSEKTPQGLPTKSTPKKTVQALWETDTVQVPELTDTNEGDEEYFKDFLSSLVIWICGISFVGAFIIVIVILYNWYKKDKQRSLLWDEENKPDVQIRRDAKTCR
uniref:U23 n=1 Tax=Human betaherpesvirus 6 TaxID=10368 RepID=A0A1W6JA57_9BETA|nr:U23 [Human betaherpesvirus 6]